MSSPRPPEFDTLSLYAGQRPDPTNGARAVPIYETTSYVFKDSDHAASLFNLEAAGHLYSRISNPTTAVLEERIAALENRVGAVCTASGTAAMHLAIANSCWRRRSHRGLGLALWRHDQPAHADAARFGIQTTLVKPRDHAGFSAAVRRETRLFIGEPIGNPGLEVLDIPVVARIAHDASVPLLIDNTFATPYLSRPIEWGADIGRGRAGRRLRAASAGSRCRT